MTDLSRRMAQERELLQARWDGPSIAWPDERFVDALLSAQAAAIPDAIALVYNDVHLSYAQLEHLSNQLGHALQTMGVGAECLVGVALERSPELVLALLGIIKAGGAYLPLDPAYPAERLAYILEDSGVHLLITQESLRSHFPASLASLCLDTFWETLPTWAAEPPPGQLVKENLAYVIYTSGSTGHPKGVQVTHGGLRNLAWAQGEAFAVKSEDRVLQFASMNFDASVSECFVTFQAGATLCLATREQMLPGAPLTSLLLEQAISMVTLPPSALATLVPGTFSALLTLVVAGEACPLDLARRWAEHCRLINAYGPTENTVCATTGVFQANDPLLTLGSPLPNTYLLLLDEQMQPVSAGEAGELYLGGAGLARGYLKRPDLTAERFVPDPFSREAGARLYRTGDRVRSLPEAGLEFLGRVDQQIKLRGFRIELGEIEHLLRTQPGIQDAAVAVHTDQAAQQFLVAYLVARPATHLNIPQLREVLKAQLPDYMLPASYLVLDALPLLANGKLNRQALPAPDARRPELANPFVAPRTTVEEQLARIWSEVLGLSKVGVYDNFFDLGGHSLRATMIQSWISDLLEVELPLNSIFALPTVAQLANLIEEKRRSGEQSQGAVWQPIVREGDLPVSFAQERVWFISQLNPDNLAYHAQALITFTGKLDIVALRQALTEIVSRHEIFRTTYPTLNGLPVQRIQPPWQVPLPVEDLRGLSESEREQAVQRLIREEARRPFDLGLLPLVRWTLLQLEDEKAILCYVEHHLVHDGWSFTVFLGELQELYIAFTAHRPSPLPPLPLQFADFTVRQRQWLQEHADVAATQRAYWVHKLSNLPGLLELPYDHPRPPVPSFVGNAFRVDLPLALAEQLRELSRQEGVTLYMLMLGAFSTLLYRYTGQEDIPIGSSVANRHWKGSKNIIGMILNNIVLRVGLSGKLSFRDFLRSLRGVAVEAYLNQDLPFDKVVEAVRPNRDLSYNPLFQVAFNFHDSPMPDLHFPGLSLDIQEAINNGSAKFDLSLTVIPRAEQQSASRQARARSITLVWEYSSDLFEPATVEQLLQHFQQLLESIVANPQQQLAELAMLTPSEREQLLASGDGPEEIWSDQRLAHLLLTERASLHPDAIALVYNDYQISYAELERRSNQLAHALQHAGIGPERLVGIALERSPELLLALLGVLKAGGAYVPLDPSYPAERLAYMLQDSQVELLLTQESLRERFSDAIPTLTLNASWEQFAAEPAQPPETRVTADNLAYIIYTSGSTGRPKGVQVPHSGLRNLVHAQRPIFTIQADQRVLQFTSINFDVSVSEIFVTLLAGATLCLGSREQILPGEDLTHFLQKQAVTVISMPPSALLPLDPARLSAIETVIVAGEACPLDLARRWSEHARFINAYGPTEYTVYTTVGVYEPDETLVTLGYPLANTHLRILDSHLRLVPAGVAGELYLGGAGLVRGYLKRPDLTAERFVPDPFSSQPGARLYRTGDRVRLLPDGRLEFLGRVDQQIKLRGFRIELGEIEHALRNQPDMQEAAVSLQKDQSGQSRLVAYLVAQPGCQLDIPVVRQALKERLPDYMLPSAYVILPALPLLANGKLNRQALPAPDSERPELSSPFVAARSEVEESLVTIWSEVLGLVQVGIHDNFFDLGGHSLLIPQVHSKIRERGITNVMIVDLFQYPTIKLLAERIQQPVTQEKMQSQAQPHRERAVLRREFLRKQVDLRPRK